MPFISIGDVFLFALCGTLLSGMVGAGIARSKSSNGVAQCVLIVSSLIGLCACVIFFYETMHSGLQSVAVPGVSLGVTPLSAFFLAIVYLGLLLTSVYAIGYLPKYASVYSLPWLNLVGAFFACGMQVTLMAPSVFWFLVGWEIMSAAAYFLVITDRSEESLHAGFIYFVMTQIGFASIMSGFLILAHGNPFATWSMLMTGVLLTSPVARALAFLLLFAGFGSKAGLVPLHQWLPYAHPQAPSHSSALLSGVMLKVALYGFVLTISLFQFVPLWCAGIVLGIGLLSAFFGALFAVVEIDAKKLLAWSSIENMGLIFSGLGVFLVLQELPQSPLTTALQSGAILFVGLHTLNHFLFKSGLFMAVGAVVSETHTRSIDDLGGLAQKWPLFSGTFLALSLSAAALPPLGTFFGEWVYVQTLAAGIATLPREWAIGSAVLLSVVALVSGFAIFAFIKMFSGIFLGRARTVHVDHVRPLSGWLTVPPMVTAILSVVSGLVAPPLLINAFSSFKVFRLSDSMVIVPRAALNSWMVLMLALVVSLICTVIYSMISRRKIRVTDTWDCGQPITPRMQYTSTGFSSPIRFFFRTVLLSRKEIYLEPIAPGNPWITSKRMEWGVSSIWERALYQPLVVAVLFTSRFVRKLQSGAIQLYLLFVILALIMAFIVAL